MSATSLNHCGQLFKRVDVPAGEKPTALPAGADAFYLYDKDQTQVLTPVWAKSTGPNATTLWSLGMGTDVSKALIFSTATYPADTGLDSPTLLVFLSKDDPDAKAFDAGSNPPRRVYEHPEPCGTMYTSTFCPLSWQGCNVYTGFCTDVDLAPRSQNGQPLPDPPSTAGNTLPFPNCTTRQVLTLEELPSNTTLPSTCTPSPDPNQGGGANASETAKAQLKSELIHKYEIIAIVSLIAIVAGGVLWFWWLSTSDWNLSAALVTHQHPPVSFPRSRLLPHAV